MPNLSRTHNTRHVLNQQNNTRIQIQRNRTPPHTLLQESFKETNSEAKSENNRPLPGNKCSDRTMKTWIIFGHGGDSPGEWAAVLEKRKGDEHASLKSCYLYRSLQPDSPNPGEWEKTITNWEYLAIRTGTLLQFKNHKRKDWSAMTIRHTFPTEKELIKFITLQQV